MPANERKTPMNTPLSRCRPARGRSVLAAFAVLTALLAVATAAAHVVESAQFAFLSRDHMTVESSQITFSSFKAGTFLFLR